MSATAPAGWVAATAALASERTPTPAEWEAIDRVLELCRSWQNGMPLVEVRKHSTGAERWTATRFTPPQHTMFRPLMAMLDALIRTDVTGAYGMQYQTPQGTFSEADLTSVRARMRRAVDGRIRILFPIRWPWLRTPDHDRGEEGERGEPVYAETYEDRWDIANARHTTETRRERKVFS